MKHVFKLGSTLKDKVTGFEGVTTGVAYYLTGCTQYVLSPKIDKDGKIPDGQWFDKERLELVKDTTLVEVKMTPTGGPQRDAPNRT